MHTIGSYRHGVALLVVLIPALAGCSSAYRQSIPASSLGGPGLADGPRSNKEPINFIRLRQDPPAVYQLGPRDVLGIYIEEVLGSKDNPMPVEFPEKGENVPPAIGYPVPVREDGTISLPLLQRPVNVTGLTLVQTERQIREAYMRPRQLIPADKPIIVTLMKRRAYQVLVVREDAATNEPTLRRDEIALEPQKRGLTHVVDLPAYENDVLHALAESGGLPGTDAKNELKILRGGFRDAQELDQVLNSVEGNRMRAQIEDSNANVIRIPLRSGPSDPPLDLSPDDIILATGDVVVIESRDSEVFYTGGLLSGGQFPIPRDYDLDVLGAMAMAGGSIAAAAGGSGTVNSPTRGGVGSIFPPTRVVVIRQVNGRQVPIGVNLKRAVLDPRERVLIQPNDLIILEYSPTEVFMNVLLNNLELNLSLNDFWD